MVRNFVTLTFSHQTFLSAYPNTSLTLFEWKMWWWYFYSQFTSLSLHPHSLIKYFDASFTILSSRMIFWHLRSFFSSFTGVLWLYNNVLKDSNSVINKFVEMQKKIYFITNNSTKTRDELVEKAKMMNFNVGMVWNHTH